MACGGAESFSSCVSYAEFTERIDRQRQNAKKISSSDHSKDTYHKLVRELYSEVVEVWEVYISKLLTESVETVFKIICNSESAQVALRKPRASATFKRAIVHHTASDRQQREEDRERLRENQGSSTLTLTRRESFTVDLCVNLLIQPNLWKQLLDDFKETLLKQCHGVTPLLSGEYGFSNMFKSILGIEKSPLDMIFEMSPFLSFSYHFRQGARDEPTVTIRSDEAVNNQLQFYYEVHCVFRDKSSSAFQSGSTLDNLSKSEFQQHFQIDDDTVSDDLYIMYQSVKNYGNRARTRYSTYVNAQRYLRAIAMRLFAAISKWFYEEFGVCIWGFDPSKCHVHSHSLASDDPCFEISNHALAS